MDDPKAAADALIAEHGAQAVDVAGDAAVAALQAGDLVLADHWKKVVWQAERMLLAENADGRSKH